MKKEKERKEDKQNIVKMIKYQKLMIFIFYEMLENNNNVILENIKDFIVKKCSYQPKIRVNSLKSSTIYACF